MNPRTATRPNATEHVNYYSLYVNRVPDGDIVDALRRQVDDADAFLGAIPEARADHRYQPDKWSIKEVLGHIVDTERTFAYRAMRIARGDATPMAGIDQDDIMRLAPFAGRTLKSLADEFRHQRLANLCLCETFDDDVLDRRGVASGFEFTTRALLYILVGHAAHHLDVIRDRYL